MSRQQAAAAAGPGAWQSAEGPARDTAAESFRFTTASGPDHVEGTDSFGSFSGPAQNLPSELRDARFEAEHIKWPTLQDEHFLQQASSGPEIPAAGVADRQDQFQAVGV